jgi:leucyl-tRNA synthetase
MYGQTNCYVGPALDYGAFEMANGEIFICTRRSALNLAYQGFTKEEGKLVQLAECKGADLVGLSVKAPLAKYEKVYVLPMETVLATKVCPSTCAADLHLFLGNWNRDFGT